jgi:hypothetical protein
MLPGIQSCFSVEILSCGNALKKLGAERIVIEIVEACSGLKKNRFAIGYAAEAPTFLHKLVT